jgi:excisionase family DNA binding protein
MDVHRENVTVAEAIQRFGIARTKLYELIREGDIEAVKLGRRTLIRAESARSFIDRLPRVGRGG